MITLNYSWYGNNGYTIQGVWVKVKMQFYVDDVLVPESPNALDLTVFVSYQDSPEEGVDGTLGLALSSYNYDMNFLQQTARKTSKFDVTNYQLKFSDTVSSDLSQQYEGEMIFSKEPIEDNMTNYFTAGNVDTDE